MDFKDFSQRFAEEVNGQYSEYDKITSLFILHLPDGRHQMVVAKIFESKRYNNRKAVHVTSKICPAKASLRYHEILRSVQGYMHTRFVIEDDFLKTEASFYLDNVNEEIIKEMILEVAYTADEWEKRITGKDIN